MDLFVYLVFIILGTLPALPRADVCKENLLSGTSPVPDKSITASSMYGIHELKHRYGPDRARLNYKEEKDAQGVTHMGAWVAENSDLNEWIQVKLTTPSLVRGIVTQGRNGGYKQWVEKFRVLYSADSHCRKWTTVGGFNVTDTFFKANIDEDTAVTNMFHCPVIARCIRVNPLAWTNYIALRFELIGCSLNAAPAPTKPHTVSTTKAPVTTTGVTKSTKAVAAPTTPKPKPGGGIKGCLKSCKGMPNGDYQSCKSCDHYVTCNWGSMFPDRPCSKGLKWDENKKVCQFRSTTCP